MRDGQVQPDMLRRSRWCAGRKQYVDGAGGRVGDESGEGAFRAHAVHHGGHGVRAGAELDGLDRKSVV